MKISLDWIKEFIDLPQDTDRIIESLTLNGFEVEQVIKPYSNIDSKIKIVKIIDYRPHPSQKELSIARIYDGRQEYTVVCGAKNLRSGAFTVWAPPGSRVLGKEIGNRRFGDTNSNGMLLSLMDLGLEERSEGIWLFNTREEIGSLLTDILMPHEVILEINVTPNRGDALSHLGIAREISAYYDLNLRLHPTNLQVVEGDPPLNITIENGAACPVYQATYAENISIKESDIRIQKRLIESGFRPINNIVDLSNYIMLETGHPTHTFDFSCLKGERIIVRNAKENEKITLLNGTTLSLNEKNLLICDESSPLALAGVMGGEYSSITGSTNRILLECAVFHPDSIRITTAMYNLSSDSSFRFARGVDPSTVDYASRRFMHLLKEEIPGSGVYKSLTVKNRDVDKKNRLSFSYDKCNRLLNITIKKDFIKKTLVALGFSIESEDSESLNIIVPSHRYDISIEEDIVEEIARIYGYNRFGIRLPHTEIFETGLNNRERFERNVRGILAGLGLNEVKNYTFISEDMNSIFSSKEAVEIKNPIAQEMASMRKSLLPSLLNTARLNLNRQNRDLRLFESGTVFFRDKEIVEESHIGILLCGNRFERVWSQPQIEYNFYDLKGVIEALFERLNIRSIEFIAMDIPKFLHPGMSAIIELSGKRIGIAGEIHPGLLSRLDIKQKIYLAELNLDPIFEYYLNSSYIFREYSPYPAIDRDIALVLDHKIAAADIIAEIRNMQLKLVEEISIFDLYEGGGIEEGKKSIGIALRYRSKDSTLTDEDVEKIHSKIIDNLMKRFYARLR